MASLSNMTAQAICAEVAAMEPGQRLVYHVGNLMEDRYNQERDECLQSGERLKLLGLSLAANTMRVLAADGVVDLLQKVVRREPDGRGGSSQVYEYVAVRRAGAR